jgi:LL-diaminopimelate aminotransferase
MFAKRIDNLPPYLFARIDEMKAKKRSEGVDVIDLGVGDPDLPTPPHIVQALIDAAQDPDNHHYPSYLGMQTFREAVAGWYKRRFSVDLDPSSEIISLMGSKDGVAHIPEVLVNPGDYVLVPSPGYPVYSTGALFSEGKVHEMPLLHENNFLPDLDAIPSDIAKKSRLMWINYPNNPTSAIAPPKFFEEVVQFARDNDVVVVSDNAYSEVSFDGYKAPSFLETDGASEVGIEMHSLSKTYNMTGWRIGMAVGNKEIIRGLGVVKTNIDSGTFNPVQHAAIAALSGPQDCVAEACSIYQERRDVLVSGLQKLGFEIQAPKATFYVWLKVEDSMATTAKMLNEAGIVVTPGIGFGKSGEGYVRFAITRSVDRIREAIGRMESVSW